MHVLNGHSSKSRDILPEIAQQYDADLLKRHTVDIFCASCAHDDDDVWQLGNALVNAWEKVTGSRHMNCLKYKVDDKNISFGDSLSALKGTALEGW